MPLRLYTLSLGSEPCGRMVDMSILGDFALWPGAQAQRWGRQGLAARAGPWLVAGSGRGPSPDFLVSTVLR